MATIQNINIGSSANDDSGTALRAGGTIINSNFTAVNNELESTTALATGNASDISSLGALSALDQVDTAEIVNSAVTLAKLADVATARILGRSTGGTGAVEALTTTQLRALINVEDGATADQNAAEVPFAADGSIAATTVQAAIVEVRDEAVSLPIDTSDVTGLDAALAGKSDDGHNHTLSDITDSGALAALDTVSSTEIDNSAVTLAKLADVVTARILGRSTGGTGGVEALDASTVRTLLNVAGALAALDTVGAAQIDSAAVTAAKIANDAVASAAILDGAVTRAKLAPRSISAQTGTSYTLDETDAQGVVTMTNASANTVTIPANEFALGDQIDIIQRGAGTTTLDAASGVLLNDVDGDSVDFDSQHSAATLLCVGSNTFQVFGAVT